MLAEFGGYEIAMMAGAVLGSAMHRRPVIIDGFIATAAALVAVRLQPAARGYCVFSHRSAERGHSLLLDALDAKPYLDLGLRLGEGTGAVMAVPLLRAAGGILTEMADLSDVLAGTLQPWPADRSRWLMLIFLTGPTRSGKSRRAVEIAQAWGDEVVFVATYRSDPGDAEMAERVRLHRAERTATWRTLEAPADIAQALGDLRPAPSGAVIDSLVLWLADRFDQDDVEPRLPHGSVNLIASAQRRIPSLSSATRLAGAPVPMDRELRRFRDLAGLLGQRTAARASQAWLMVAGCGVRLK